MRLPVVATALTLALFSGLAPAGGEAPPILEGVRIDVPEKCVEPDPGPAPPPGVSLPPRRCPSVPQVKSISYSLHGPGNDWYAARSIDMDGTVHGLHASRSGSGPMIAESRETARPEDLAELQALAQRLPSPADLPPPADRANAAYSELDVQFADGTTRQFYLPDGQPFTDPALGRFQAIIRSYRAGYW